MEPRIGLHHVALRCRDLERCERFYREVIGLEVLRRWPADGGGDRSVWLALDGGRGFLALERAESEGGGQPADAAPAGWHVVALSISRRDRSRWEDRLAGLGVEIDRKTQWSLFLRDPEGNRLALSHWPEAS
ncbi:MAG TPA: VOC family protein [Anaeromyxobacteraceae bacterium]|nr:VOC family protein [Anaeromyxobacteraceae bacterium]